MHCLDQSPLSSSSSSVDAVDWNERRSRGLAPFSREDPETARTTLADDGWDACVHRLPLPLAGRGESRVLHQSPAAGTALPEGTAVHVWVG